MPQEDEDLQLLHAPLKAALALTSCYLQEPSRNLMNFGNPFEQKNNIYIYIFFFSSSYVLVPHWWQEADEDDMIDSRPNIEAKKGGSRGSCFIDCQMAEQLHAGPPTGSKGIEEMWALLNRT